MVRAPNYGSQLSTKFRKNDWRKSRSSPCKLVVKRSWGGSDWWKQKAEGLVQNKVQNVSNETEVKLSGGFSAEKRTFQRVFGPSSRLFYPILYFLHHIVLDQDQDCGNSRALRREEDSEWTLITSRSVYPDFLLLLLLLSLHLHFQVRCPSLTISDEKMERDAVNISWCSMFNGGRPRRAGRRLSGESSGQGQGGGQGGSVSHGDRRSFGQPIGQQGWCSSSNALQSQLTCSNLPAASTPPHPALRQQSELPAPSGPATSSIIYLNILILYCNLVYVIL